MLRIVAFCFVFITFVVVDSSSAARKEGNIRMKLGEILQLYENSFIMLSWIF